MTELMYLRFLKKVDKIMISFSRFMAIDYKRKIDRVDSHRVTYFFDDANVAFCFEYLNGAYISQYHYIMIPWLKMRIRTNSFRNEPTIRFSRYTSYKMLVEQIYRIFTVRLGIHHSFEPSASVADKILVIADLSESIT